MGDSRYYIQPNHSNVVPVNHLAVHCVPRVIKERSIGNVLAETLHCWCAAKMKIKGDAELMGQIATGYAPDYFWSHVADRLSWSSPLWVWMHGGFAQCTMLNIWSVIDNGDIRVHWSSYGPRPWVLVGSMYGRSIVFCDLHNWFDATLQDIPPISADETQLLSALEPDDGLAGMIAEAGAIKVRTVVKDLVRYIQSNNLGMMRHTISGQSYASWRHTHKGPWPHLHHLQPVQELERATYHGGRVKIFWKGNVTNKTGNQTFQDNYTIRSGPTLFNEQSHIWDVRAMYPYVMKTNHFPYRLTDYVADRTITIGEVIDECPQVIARVIVKSDDVEYAAETETGKVWAVGTFPTTLCGHELIEAIELGKVTKVLEYATYEFADLFSEWVSRHWERRTQFIKSDNKVWAALEKKLANSLHGYLARRQSEWANTEIASKKKQWGHWIEETEPNVYNEFRAIAGTTQLRRKTGEHYSSIPFVSGFVAQYARKHLAYFAKYLEANELLYSDTDSLHTTISGNSKLADRFGKEDGTLGGIRLQEGPCDASYYGTRIYKFGERWVIAGVAHNKHILGEGKFTHKVMHGIGQFILGCNRGIFTSSILDAIVQSHKNNPPKHASGWVKPSTQHLATRNS